MPVYRAGIHLEVMNQPSGAAIAVSTSPWTSAVRAREPTGGVHRLCPPDRDDLGDVAIVVEDNNRFPARRATKELTGPIAKLANLDAASYCDRSQGTWLNGSRTAWSRMLVPGTRAAKTGAGSTPVWCQRADRLKSTTCGEGRSADRTA